MPFGLLKLHILILACSCMCDLLQACSVSAASQGSNQEVLS